ncbi:Guanylate kinase [Sedimentisphaera cyanobacteriorum]|uniref:Guanylate kinase n=1 Tax=Sedimentisphaera cyanobacteriorum TaxID=1940790 RepID=A0A1Q2HNT1_9BACT|nr:hypothetical protein [Sedimentisphaera cyanobacteriorum]AQQ08896.1 Guanylate kinase [Sedimentisphaera cyanobacteriorum]
MGKLIILSGPSCVGKGPLFKSLCKFYPTLAGSLKKCVLYNSRSPRPGETDGEEYHFRKRKTIEALRENNDYLVLEVRCDLQAMDIRELTKMLQRGNVFFEGNPFVVSKLLKAGIKDNIKTLKIFLSPLSIGEIQELQEIGVCIESFITDIMRRKLLRRTNKHKGILSQKDLENIEIRASSAFIEMQTACLFDAVIPNHDGEDSENWDAFYYPIADSRKTLKTFVQLLRTGRCEEAEYWPENLLKKT